MEAFVARLEFSATEVLTEEMDTLRMHCFPAVTEARSSRDDFDVRSLHVALRIGNVLAAYGRLTPGPHGVFEAWTGGAAEIPTGPQVADLGRCLVAPSFRGLKLFSLVCLESLLVAAERGFTVVVGAVIPGRTYANALYAIGFSDSGPVVDVRDPGGNCDRIQPLIADCSRAREWEELKRIKLTELAHSGWERR